MKTNIFFIIGAILTYILFGMAFSNMAPRDNNCIAGHQETKVICDRYGK